MKKQTIKSKNDSVVHKNNSKAVANSIMQEKNKEQKNVGFAGNRTESAATKKLNQARVPHNRYVQMVIQMLTEEEKEIKLKALEDYVRITPPVEVPDGYVVPNTKEAYYKNLLKKIRSNGYYMESLKAKKNMQADVNDDDWDNEAGFNCITLKKAIDNVYTNQLVKDNKKLGKAYNPFNEHDCVWAAISHARGQGDDLAKEKQIADEFHHEYGEVDDAVLYRVMEKLGYPFLGKGSWDDFFGPSLFESKGKFIVSENKDAAGTSGHVFVVEPKEGKVVKAFDVQTDQWQIYDRQFERQSQRKRTNFPAFDIYVWKVK